jgi:multidrug efflux system outer membrane protein
VEVSLNDVHMYSISLDAQHRAVESAQRYYDLSDVEFKQGIVSALQLIDADRTLLSNQQAESQIAQQRLISTVLLIKALGGGWTPSTKAP